MAGTVLSDVLSVEFNFKAGPVGKVDAGRGKLEFVPFATITVDVDVKENMGDYAN